MDFESVLFFLKINFNFNCIGVCPFFINYEMQHNPVLWTMTPRGAVSNSWIINSSSSSNCAFETPTPLRKSHVFLCYMVTKVLIDSKLCFYGKKVALCFIKYQSVFRNQTVDKVCVPVVTHWNTATLVIGNLCTLWIFEFKIRITWFVRCLKTDVK